MTQKEKAEELVNKFYSRFDITNKSYKNSKQCALIAVDELIEVLSMDANPLVNYWFEVKQEIKKL